MINGMHPLVGPKMPVREGSTAPSGSAFAAEPRTPHMGRTRTAASPWDSEELTERARLIGFFGFAPGEADSMLLQRRTSAAAFQAHLANQRLLEAARDARVLELARLRRLEENRAHDAMIAGKAVQVNPGSTLPS